MTKKEQQAHFGYITDQMRKTLFSKGDDYANEDRLSNFKLAGAIAGGDARTNCLNLISTKVARLGVLINSDKEPNNERNLNICYKLVNDMYKITTVEYKS